VCHDPMTNNMETTIIVAIIRYIINSIITLYTTLVWVEQNIKYNITIISFYFIEFINLRRKKNKLYVNLKRRVD